MPPETTTPQDHFPAAYARLQLLEGPDTQDPDDPGGHTRFGIAQSKNPDIDVAGLGEDDARQRLYWKYWLSPGFDRIRHRALAVKAFTLGVLIGPGKAARLLQTALNCLQPAADLVEDGLIGPASAAAINGYRHPAAVEEVLESLATAYLLGLGKQKYIAGWVMRVDA
jgi:lysozyme family protein